jgi:SAM-dependent methyltransferase
MPNDPVHLGEDIIKFYTDRLKSYGNSSQGVGWKNDLAQDTRFEQLCKVITSKNGFSVNDLGCGTGKLYFFLQQQGYEFVYKGYDILDEMVNAAIAAITDPTAVIKKINDSQEMEDADYSVGSGIFNIKYNTEYDVWTKHVVASIHSMNEKSRLGFSFNCLTKYSDKEFMQDYLYYADPLFLFDYCKTNFSRNVSLLHDYDQYDFTIIVRK